MDRIAFALSLTASVPGVNSRPYRMTGSHRRQPLHVTH
jgi:hypothetical protein